MSVKLTLSGEHFKSLPLLRCRVQTLLLTSAYVRFGPISGHPSLKCWTTSLNRPKIELF
jgi:hypothetical protein